MSEQDLEVLITIDDPGEEDLEEDTFHQPGNTGHRSTQPGGDPPGQTEVIARRR